MGFLIGTFWGYEYRKSGSYPLVNSREPDFNSGWNHISLPSLRTIVNRSTQWTVQ
ncbi:hypothetical protein D3C73_610690 [compost metagenome]